MTAQREGIIENNLYFVISRALITIVLLTLGCWAVAYNWPQRLFSYDNFSFSDEDAHRFEVYPEAQYAYGLNAWMAQQPERAASYFRQTVSQNVLFIDAWLKLAETNVSLGRTEKAGAILTFTADMTKRAIRWKWPQALLARDLAMDANLYGNLNDLMTNYLFERDALQMLHTHLEGDASAVINVLDPDHLTIYLRWLMRWGMTDESRMVWQAATDAGQPNREIALDYAHFLLGRKHIEQSRMIWERYTGITGLTNAGFEAKITGKAFDWRHWGEQDGFWELDRVKGRPPEGQYALKIVFKGRENLAFHHLYQIITVAPEEDYRLTYAWKSSGLTTDQRPYIEIMSYDAEGLYQPGPMMDRSQNWQTDFVEFSVPEGCRAVLVRLRRRPSHRFDSKIRGTVWLDDFQLEKLPTGVAPSDGGHQSNH